MLPCCRTLSSFSLPPCARRATERSPDRPRRTVLSFHWFLSHSHHSSQCYFDLVLERIKVFEALCSHVAMIFVTLSDSATSEPLMHIGLLLSFYSSFAVLVFLDLLGLLDFLGADLSFAARISQPRSPPTLMSCRVVEIEGLVVSDVWFSMYNVRVYSHSFSFSKLPELPPTCCVHRVRSDPNIHLRNSLDRSHIYSG